MEHNLTKKLKALIRRKKVNEIPCVGKKSQVFPTRGKSPLTFPDPHGQKEKCYASEFAKHLCFLISTKTK